MMKAPVNKIIPFSNVDGPGNRCAIFFQSCPFSCLYCHNPETIHMCCHCGECILTCPTNALFYNEKKEVVWDKTKCVDCDTCIKVCPHLASAKITWMTAQALLEEVKKVQFFIRGITVSGGECMNQAAFLKEFFPLVKDLGLSILIDSNGVHDFFKHEDLLTYCDGVMLDIKATNSMFHKEMIGYDNAMVLKNLDYLLSVNKLEEVRTVILPNNQKQNCETIQYVVDKIQNRCRYKLIAYRPYGVRKDGLKKLGKQSVTKEEMQYYKEFADRLGNTTNTII